MNEEASISSGVFDANTEQDSPLVLALDDVSATLERVGGKGSSLARLTAAGLPVPPGFHITTTAYRMFVARHGLQEQILAAVSTASPDQPVTCDVAAQTIAVLFAQHSIPDEVAAAIRQAYSRLGGGDLSVAVRSSATAEDLPDLSFAGQQETYLNMRGAAMVLDAVKRCWASLWTARAISYRIRNDIASAEVSLAVVVQELVSADAAGIMFTANPVTGGHDQIMINAAWGLGEAIVGGLVTPDTVVVDKNSGAIVTYEINEKDVMTMRTSTGTREEPVPVERRRQAVLSPAQVAELARLGMRIEQLYGQPMDIEWVLSADSFFIVQARPITSLHQKKQGIDAWNDSLTVDCLWTRGNAGEAVPDVTTPCSRSLLQIVFDDMMPTLFIGGYSPIGYIGGRLYMNLSVMMTIMAAVGMKRKRLIEATGDIFGRVPDDLDIPVLPVPRWTVLRTVLPATLRNRRRIRGNIKKLPAFLATAPTRCEELLTRIQSASSLTELTTLWQDNISPYLHECNYMLEVGSKSDGGAFIKVRSELRKLVGEADTNILLLATDSGTNQLASLGPLQGLTQLMRGEIDRATFARQYGHHSPHLFEISYPRPAEDPQWIDQQLAGLREAPTDIMTLLARQKDAQEAAWDRFQHRYPRQAEKMRGKIARAGRSAHEREAARSEQARVFWPLRAFVLRAGELTGYGEKLFFLSMEEILALLKGDDTALASVAERQAIYAGYCALPSFPALIRGHFDPFQWAANPQRRSDVFDANGKSVPASDAVTGFPGAPGTVEGRARVVLTVEEGEQLQSGEVLVTTLTNIGWTPLFPRAVAVVTDVGAPLSHASIVARELGIPAVVGCGNATMRLHTGDWLRVNGELGTVEILQAPIENREAKAEAKRI
ncbi:MAG: PEP/pyruvate-binding domain-containing protein [Ktedonobacteraceae bacterium]